MRLADYLGEPTARCRGCGGDYTASDLVDLENGKGEHMCKNCYIERIQEENIRLRTLIAKFERVFLNDASELSWEKWRILRNATAEEVLKIAQQVKEAQS